MVFAPILPPSSPLSHPPNTIMNYKLYLHVGSKRIFENTMHKYSLKIQKSQTTETFHVETFFSLKLHLHGQQGWRTPMQAEVTLGPEVRKAEEHLSW